LKGKGAYFQDDRAAIAILLQAAQEFTQRQIPLPWYLVVLEEGLKIRPASHRLLAAQVAKMDVHQARPEDLVGFDKIVAECAGVGRIQSQMEIVLFGEISQLMQIPQEIASILLPEEGLILQTEEQILPASL